MGFRLASKSVTLNWPWRA